MRTYSNAKLWWWRDFKYLERKRVTSQDREWLSERATKKYSSFTWIGNLQQYYRIWRTVLFMCDLPRSSERFSFGWKHTTHFAFLVKLRAAREHEWERERAREQEKENRLIPSIYSAMTCAYLPIVFVSYIFCASFPTSSFYFYFSQEWKAKL